MSLLASWILAAMISAQPAAPWRDTYPATAVVLARVSEAAPLFQGTEGARRTAAELVSLAWFESRFDPNAKGDCRRQTEKGACLSAPQSLGLFQIGISNLEDLDLTPSDLFDVEISARTAERMIRTSMRVCRGRPFEEHLGHYASGRAVCGGLRESRHRVLKARWLFDHIPFPADPPS